MERKEIINGLTEILQDYVEEIPETLDENMCLASDIGIDSFSLANMILAIEDKFEVKILDRDLVNFQTIKDMVDYIQSKKA